MSSTVPTISYQSTQRPCSVRSVASNSSFNSSISLSRRPRTMRARSRTATGGQPYEESSQSPTLGLPYTEGSTVEEPLEGLPIHATDPRRLLPHTAASQRSTSTATTDALTSTDVLPSPASENGTAEATYVEIPNISMVSTKSNNPKSNRPTLSAIDIGYKPPPSAFSRDPAMTTIAHARDSVSTQQSGTSSSMYPPSTSTASGPESPSSPQSMADQVEQFGDSVVKSAANDFEGYDNDDVAYRLKLLAKNSYFLPPAHSKPLLSDLIPSPTNVNKPSKTGSPTFLDLFRVGRARSKPTTPTNSNSPTAPMLRTTSDSITLLRTQPRTSSQSPRMSPLSPSSNPRGRVVVVREKMNDLMVAAKQVEQDVKFRAARLDLGLQKSPMQVYEDVIDPTDIVDLPPPSSNYPFAVQASALHGLGVLDSVGAAALADRLPPPKSSNMSTSYDTEDDWRKALLHEAVHHSLDATPDMSSFSHIQAASTPMHSPRSKQSELLSGDDSHNSNTNANVQQRILEPPIFALMESDPLSQFDAPEKISQNQPTSSTPSRSLTSSESQAAENFSRPHSFLPVRAETPCDMTPLSPPPRQKNPVAFQHIPDGMNQNVIHQSEDVLRESSTMRPLRRVQSTPMLSDAHDSSSDRIAEITPPPLPALCSRMPSRISLASYRTHRERQVAASMLSLQSHCFADEQEDTVLPQDSIISLPMEPRPSLSDYSRASISPTTSAFQDLLNHDGYMSASSSIRRASNLSFEQNVEKSSESHNSRFSTMSPPPRISSSLAHIALSPPPRPGHNHSRSIPHPSQHSLVSARQEYSLATATENSSSDRVHGPILAPERMIPPLPASFKRDHSSSGHSPLYLNIPNSRASVVIHSAPPPISPTNFFDTIQTHPNAMDDLESSSDEEDAPEDNSPPARVHRVFSDSGSHAPTRPSITRLGNHSAPYISRPIDGLRDVLGITGPIDPRRPIANVPVRAPFFSERKSDVGPLPAPSSDLLKHTHDQTFLGAVSMRPPTVESANRWQSDQKAQESLRKLDGMLVQHMETEKDTIKRIATTLKQSTPVAKHSVP